MKLAGSSGRSESWGKITGRAVAQGPCGESEMRKQFLAVLLSSLIMAFITAAAQTQDAGIKHATLQSVNVVRTSDGVNLEINAHGNVKPRLSTMENPARVLVDLPNTVIASSPRL